MSKRRITGLWEQEGPTGELELVGKVGISLTLHITPESLLVVKQNPQRHEARQPHYIAYLVTPEEGELQEEKQAIEDLSQEEHELLERLENAREQLTFLDFSSLKYD